MKPNPKKAIFAVLALVGLATNVSAGAKGLIKSLEVNPGEVYVQMVSMSAPTGCSRGDFYILDLETNVEHAKRLLTMIQTGFALGDTVNLGWINGSCKGEFVKITYVGVIK